MKKQKAYVNLANWFEYLNDDCDYEKWSQYLICKLKPFSFTKGIDIGWGGGWFTRAFIKAGYQMTGLDQSWEMLNFAQNQALKLGQRGEYILGDITNVKLPKRFDFATAINDCINYIPKGKLSKAFKNIYASLNQGGIFLFDISSVKKFNEKIANTVSVDDREDITYLCFNKLEEEKATMDVTLFVKQVDGTYQRLDETHTQYLYSKQEIVSTLQNVGFNLIEVTGHLGEDENVSDRLCFLAQKGEKR